MWITLLEALRKKQWLVAGILVLTIGAVGEFPRMKSCYFATVDEYAFKVVSYGISIAPNSLMIEAVVAKWKKDRWGAQIAALRVLCTNKDSRLREIMSEQQITKVCRMVQ